MIFGISEQARGPDTNIERLVPPIPNEIADKPAPNEQRLFEEGRVVEDIPNEEEELQIAMTLSLSLSKVDTEKREQHTGGEP